MELVVECKAVLCVSLYWHDLHKRNKKKNTKQTIYVGVYKSYGRDCASGIAGAIKPASIVLLACWLLLTADFRSIRKEKKKISVPIAPAFYYLYLFIRKKNID